MTEHRRYTTNESRQDSAHSVLSHYRRVMKMDSDAEALVDLLTDLRHICHVRDDLSYHRAAHISASVFGHEMSDRKEKLS